MDAVRTCLCGDIILNMNIEKRYKMTGGEKEKLKTPIETEINDEEFEDAQRDKYLTFKMGVEEYGIDIRHVIEIIGIINITVMPDTPFYVKGVINLRGKVIPVIDVRLRFAMAEKKYDERTCVIVIMVGGQHVGLIVDEVSEVLDIPQPDIEVPPKMSKSGGRFVQGMGKVGEKVKILLNADRLLFEEEFESISN